jgi:hypothetical protein
VDFQLTAEQRRLQHKCRELAADFATRSAAHERDANGYPGPAHVLTLANELELTKSQLEQVTAIYDRMNAAAKLLP